VDHPGRQGQRTTEAGKQHSGRQGQVNHHWQHSERDREEREAGRCRCTASNTALGVPLTRSSHHTMPLRLPPGNHGCGFSRGEAAARQGACKLEEERWASHSSLLHTTAHHWRKDEPIGSSMPHRNVSSWRWRIMQRRRAEEHTGCSQKREAGRTQVPKERGRGGQGRNTCVMKWDSGKEGG
jgi:hypothetical protein